MQKKSKFSVNVGEKSHIVIEWSDNPVNYSHEAKKQIISVVSNRYGVPKSAVKVNFIPQKYDNEGKLIDVSSDIINNIQDPSYQVKLFNDYITENNITDVDFEYIKKIDSEINSKIDYEIYEKHKKYEIEWIEWSNFLSYGENNRLEFSKLQGLTLLNGSPVGNQNGKSSLAIDLTSFLLFGETQKPYTLSEMFNKFLDVNSFYVRGGLKIDGEQYVIDRTVTRAKKRTGGWGDASQKVNYYRIINGEKEELKEDSKENNEQGEHSIRTNKIIKESIGSKKDFKMIVSATSEDLFDLIKTGNTEKGRLLSKWVGLLPLEEKEKIGKEKYKDFEKTLKSKTYNKLDLENENVELLEKIKITNENNELLQKRILELNDNLISEQQNKDTLLLSKQKIDENVLKIDVNTINRKLTDIISNAEVKKQELNKHTEEYNIVKDVFFDNEVYKEKFEKDKKLSIEKNNATNEIRNLTSTNKNLLESEYCPTCKRKYDGLDNSTSIKENDAKICDLNKKEQELKTQIEQNKKDISDLEVIKVNYDRKTKLDSLIEIIPVQIENLRNEYREKQQLIKDYNNNKESIEKNNQIDITLTNVNAKIKNITIEKEDKVKSIENGKRTIDDCDKKIKINDLLIKEIDGELVKIKNWKVYLEMVGKNGVSKMVLKKTLPFINSEISRLLENVCDFDVEVVLTEKNEIEFKIIQEGVASDLAGASGFEKTASALALRCVLSNISTMPKPNFITLDEILMGVAKDNYENMFEMYKKIEQNYQFILHVTHLEDIKEWHKNTITVNKTNNTSSIKTSF